MKILRLVTTLIAILLAAPVAATGGTINFTGLNLSSVSSASGQDFAYTVGAGAVTGTVNVRLTSGTPSSVQAGSNPDATGFYALQSAPNLPPMVFRFTFDTPRNFSVTENESQATIEVNSFTLSSGSWTLLSATDTTPTSSGSTITFVAANNSPPYGEYAIAGSGSFFDFQITNSPGFPVYGSAISVNIVSEAPLGPDVVISRAVKLRWQTQSGKTYQPQYSYDLSNWSNLGSALSGTGLIMQLFDSTESDAKKFYRILIQ